MLKRRPGVFACGEMLDWDAPTGGYLLQACFATARHAAEAVRARLEIFAPHDENTATDCA
jgi:predicted flavoprotein YhiN